MAKETSSQANKDSRAPDVFLGRRRFLAAAVGIASIPAIATEADGGGARAPARDRKSTRLNSSHDQISYAVFCLKKKKRTPATRMTLTGPASATTGSR